MKNDFILLTGCPRSGTTFFATLIEDSFNIAIPLESFFIPHFARFIGFWGDLRKPSNARSLHLAIRDYLRILLYLGIRAKKSK